MKLYHRTRAAAAVLTGGFEERSGHDLTDALHTGVWFADRTDVNEEAAAWTLLALEIPDDVLEPYEWVQDATQGHREWLIPAALANQYGPPRVVSPDEEREIIDPRR